MFGASKNTKKQRAFYETLEEAGLQHYFPLLKGGEGAIQMQHLSAMKQKLRQAPERFTEVLKDAGITDADDREKLSALLQQRMEEKGGLQLKPITPPTAETDAEAWQAGLADEHGQLPAEIAALREHHQDAHEGKRGEDGEEWPPGMNIVNGHLAHSIRAQGMIQEPNQYGYIHLAGEVERIGPLHKNSSEKKALLQELKAAAQALLEAHPDEVQRADVFDAFLLHPGAKEGWKLIADGKYDVHTAEFDVVVLVECRDPDTAVRIRQSDAFLAMKASMDRAARFVHCITAKNPKRIAEVDKSKDGVFLFNYFFAADIDAKGAEGVEILLGVWEYTAGWWTAKANLTNSTPLQPLDHEHSSYSLINHCRWDKGINVFPHLIFRPSLEKFVIANFTANDIVAMPILYHLA